MRAGTSNPTYCARNLKQRIPLAALLVALLAGCVATQIVDVESIEDPPIAAGPMLGHVSDSSAPVWLPLAAGASLDAYAHHRGRRYAPAQVRDLQDGFRLGIFEGLSHDADFDLRGADRRSSHGILRHD